ncbi:hypothetical protein GIB67_019511 [Kingdonia uniflora]|uniref:Peptidyl-prolyl cis-trans isomerase n=1 Tax=Kingdonia uniflora TaxID=39325 RepID=A0A7J7N049_9MAGN|nr:hypothetical protein GIB67_019511 [Kingdonia uniflora]
MSSSSSTKVKASHILIKHQGLRRKASWKDPEGPFGRGQMPFEEATFSLKVGEISDIVEIGSDVHIIMRTD